MIMTTECPSYTVNALTNPAGLEQFFRGGHTQVREGLANFAFTYLQCLHSVNRGGANREGQSEKWGEGVALRGPSSGRAATGPPRQFQQIYH